MVTSSIAGAGGAGRAIVPTTEAPPRADRLTTLLRQGRAPKAVAQAAGYASTAAFGRAFVRRVA